MTSVTTQSWQSSTSAMRSPGLSGHSRPAPRMKPTGLSLWSSRRSQSIWFGGRVPVQMFIVPSSCWLLLNSIHLSANQQDHGSIHLSVNQQDHGVTQPDIWLSPLLAGCACLHELVELRPSDLIPVSCASRKPYNRAFGHSQRAQCGTIPLHVELYICFPKASWWNAELNVMSRHEKPP